MQVSIFAIIFASIFGFGTMHLLTEMGERRIIASGGISHLTQGRYISGQMPIRPLTHRNRQEEVYQRSEQVTAQIQVALTLGPANLIQRAQIRDFRASDYLQEECLVYLIREYLKEDAKVIVNQLAQELLQRCAKYINSKLAILGEEAAKEAYHDVITELFAQIVDLTSDRGDFLEVRFWKVVDRLAISAFNSYCDDLNRAREAISLSSLAGAGHEEKTDEHRSQREVAAPLSFLEQAPLLRDALKTLEEPYRTVFVLRHYEGWKIEASDPSEPSISKYFRKTPPTIRSWLTKAEATIRQWRGEEP